LIVLDIVARTGINEAMIKRLVHGFYERARRDSLIGRVFDDNVADWDDHLRRMCDFWSSVTLMTGRYRGQPMAKHLRLPIDTPHFDRWLAIFAETARELCPTPADDHFIERARRIADSLELGIAFKKGKPRPRRLRGQPTPRPRASAGSA
jgi:hemoglobin